MLSPAGDSNFLCAASEFEKKSFRFSGGIATVFVTNPVMASLSPTPICESILKAKHGEVGPLLEQYKGYLLILARVELGRQIQRKLDPADLVQETFLDACRNFALFRGSTEAALLVWLRQILAGKTANALRHYLGTQARDTRREFEQDLTRSFDRSAQRLRQLATASEASPSRIAMRREQAVIVANALQGLPAHYREVLLLRHWDELTFPSIAQRMGRSVPSVEKLWVRALTKLRHTMGTAE